MSYIISEQRVKQFNSTQNRTEYSASIICDDVASLPTNNSDYWYLLGSDAKVISNGKRYIINSSGIWVEQPSENAWENVYTKAEIDEMITEIYGIIAYYHTILVSDTGEITFYSLGGNVGTWTIYGNGQQNGTPTPDNPVMPEFVGVRTDNLAPTATYSNERTDTLTDFRPVLEMRKSGARVRARYYAAIGSAGAYSFGFTVEDDIDEIRLIHNGSNRNLYPVDIFDSFALGDYVLSATFTGANPSEVGGLALENIMLNSGSTPLPYEPYGYKIPLTCAGQTTPLYLGEVSTVRRIKKLVLTGEEDWILYTNYDAQNAFQLNVSTPSMPDIYKVSDHYLFKNVLQDFIYTDNTFMLTMTSIRVHDSRYDTTNAFKQYLRDQYANGTPVTIWYVLTTEQTGIVNEPLMKIGDYADELHSEDAGVTIPTVSGQNTLTVETDLKPSKIVISGESN